VTAEDSGGPAELVKHGESGYLVPPDPLRLAQAFDTLAETKGLAEKMGHSGYEFVARFSWPETVRKLLIFQNSRG
jgi:glycosyltransferase involved in cell wall biosynthesis